MDGDEDGGRVVFPFEGELAGGAAETGKGVFQVLNHRHRFAHLHLGAAQILGLVIAEAPFARLLAHDENPVVGIGDVDEEGVVPLGNGQVANCDVSVASVWNAVALLAPARQTG